MQRNVKLIALVIASLGFAAAQATPITPTSYDMVNGETGSFTYWDDSYDGSGSTTSSLASLSGGLGELTDGIIATQNWNSTPGPYVGWRSVNPTITFNFATTVNIDTVTLFVDDSNGYGGVATPGSVSIDGANYSIVDPASPTPLAVTISNLGFSGSSLDIQLFEGTRTWLFVSEVQFDGEAVIATAEPATLALFGLGLAGFAFGRRRKA